MYISIYVDRNTMNTPRAGIMGMRPVRLHWTPYLETQLQLGLKLYFHHLEIFNFEQGTLHLHFVQGPTN